MLRRLHTDQPESFAFTDANAEWARGQIAKYPEGRQASAVIPLLWRAQEQEGWVTKPAIEAVAKMLDMAPIRVLEVASFYFMFQLQPVGSVAHFQICGTTSCMICGAEDLIAVCRERIAANPHELSGDGRFSWEEVECLGACSNAPMAQIGKDYYEDLTVENFGAVLDAFEAGQVPRPGSQTGRYAAEPAGGLTSLRDGERAYRYNGSVTLAEFGKDTVKRITGDEPVLRMTESAAEMASGVAPVEAPAQPKLGDGESASVRRAAEQAGELARMLSEPEAVPEGAPEGGVPGPEPVRPAGLEAPRNDAGDDLKKIKGVGPKLEALLQSLGFWHFDQIAAWTDAEVAWVDDNLDGFKGRVTRDEWVEQARILAGGGETEFSQRVDDGDVY